MHIEQDPTIDLLKRPNSFMSEKELGRGLCIRKSSSLPSYPGPLAVTNQ